MNDCINIHKLNDLLNTNKTLHEIAEYFGITYNELRWVMRSNGLKKECLGSIPHKDAIKIYNYSCTHTAKDTAKYFNITINQVKRIRKNQLKLKSKIKDEYLKKIIKESRYLASTSGHADIADDFSGYAALRVIEGNCKINIKWVLADFLKQTYGKIDTNKNSFLWNEKKNPIEIVDSLSKNKDGVTLAAKERENNYILDKAIELNLSQADRSVFILYYSYDFTLKEIGSVLGISENEAWQRLDEVHFKIKKENNYD